MMRSEMVQLVRVQRSSTVNHFWERKKRVVRKGRLSKGWRRCGGRQGCAAPPFPSGHPQHQGMGAQECADSPHSSCLTSAPHSP